jgi:broad specificity phosphatase PhoE
MGDLPKDKNIIIVTHSGIINATITALFNVGAMLKGDVSKGKNTTITAIEKKHNTYKLLTIPNTKHLG